MTRDPFTRSKEVLATLPRVYFYILWVKLNNTCKKYDGYTIMPGRRNGVFIESSRNVCVCMSKCVRSCVCQNNFGAVILLEE